ncbi:hypothetical protein Cni_G25101 [Canna indica]|uniref:Sel1-like protein n=1 Tax=Canna indica TaxID=4628 RepID=A0AAQ3KX02_9LILI|nr:hypothetical protein Cni_G25101 [Canna indica]
MGRRLPSLASLESCARIAAEKLHKAKLAKHAFKSLASNKQEAAGISSAGASGSERRMEHREQQKDRVPLKDVVADCTKRWFQDALKEARGGDAAMQVLVGQMYHSGYGIPKIDQKANSWISKASRYRSSVWKVSNKRPGSSSSVPFLGRKANIYTYFLVVTFMNLKSSLFVQLFVVAFVIFRLQCQ